MSEQGVGTVELIHVTDTAGAELRSVDSVNCVPGLGIEGDRKVLTAKAEAEASGGMPTIEPGRQLTLITAEGIAAAAKDLGRELPPGITRRNVTIRGIEDLLALAGETFQVGDVVVRGIEDCTPCAYLQELTGIDGITKAFVGRGGLRCEVVSGGRIAVGDPVGARVSVG